MARTMVSIANLKGSDMKIYIVTHTHTDSDEWADTEVVSAHISRSKAEEYLAKERAKLLNERYGDYDPDSDECSVGIETNLDGWFKVCDNETFETDELLIHEENIID